MANFASEFLTGQKGLNKGISLGPELEALSNAMYGLQKGKIIGVGSPPKVKENGGFCWSC